MRHGLGHRSDETPHPRRGCCRIRRPRAGWHHHRADRGSGYFGGKRDLFTHVLRDELVKVAQAVPVESFATEDVGEYAGRVYDYHLEHPELERLLRWEGLAFDARNPDDEQRMGRYRDKTAAVEAGQRAGSVTEEIDADHMIFLILSLAGWWSSVPQVARMLTGSDTEAERARRRESVVWAARRIARPD